MIVFAGATAATAVDDVYVFSSFIFAALCAKHTFHACVCVCTQ